MGQLLRAMNFCVSRDGFAAAENQTLEVPFGLPNPERLFKRPT